MGRILPPVLTTWEIMPNFIQNLDFVVTSTHTRCPIYMRPIVVIMFIDFVWFCRYPTLKFFILWHLDWLGSRQALVFHTMRVHEQDFNGNTLIWCRFKPNWGVIIFVSESIHVQLRWKTTCVVCCAASISQWVNPYSMLAGTLYISISIWFHIWVRIGMLSGAIND